MADSTLSSTNPTAHDRYESLKVKREPFLRRARDHAELTIPSIQPPEGHNWQNDLPEPYQEFGARLVKNLASLILKAILPTTIKSFKLGVPNETLLKNQQILENAQVKLGLAHSEGLIQSEIERRAWRQPTQTSLLQLIVTGNSCEHMLADNRIRVFRLDQYVACRDASGNLLELVIHEKVSPMMLSPTHRAAVKAEPSEYDDKKEVDLYTWVRRQDNNTFKAHQEIDGTILAGTEGKFREDTLPYFVLRFSEIVSEDYGRGMVEEHIGGFRSLEEFHKSIIDGAAMAARHVWWTRPNAAGVNIEKKLAKAKNGDVVQVNGDTDVGMLKADNYANMQFVSAELNAVKESLAAAFVLATGQRRDAERVTAAEIRMIAEELETAVGGVYSLLAQEMQAPRIRRLVLQMQAQDKLPKWPDDLIEPTVITGLDALNREQDVIRIQNTVSVVNQMPQEAQDRVKWNELLPRLLIGAGLPAAVKSEEEYQAFVQQRAQLATMERAAGPVGSALVNASAQQGAPA